MNTTPPNRTDVGIVGAGITGLCLAHFLERRGIGVHVLEMSDRPGGVIRSERVREFLFEHGPTSAVKTTPAVDELVANLALSESLEYANASANNRYIVRGGRLRRLPSGPLSAVRTDLFSWRAKLRVLGEPFVRRGDGDEDESLARFVERRLGREMLDYAVDPFVAGVYAGTPENLSVRSAFPKLHALEQRYGSLIKGAVRGRRERRGRVGAVTGMLSFTGGMQTLVDSVAAGLSGSIETCARVHSVQKNDSGFLLNLRSPSGERTLHCRAAVLAIPAHAYDVVHLDLGPSVQDALKRIHYPPVTVVFFGYHKRPQAIDLDGFGFLVPAREERRILGTLWNSSVFADRAPGDGAALTTYVGGSRTPQAAALPDDQLVSVVVEELEELLGIKTPPDVTVVKRWARAIPQYNHGHHTVIERIEQLESDETGLFIAGSFRNGVSVVDCIDNAHALCEKVVRVLAPE